MKGCWTLFILPIVIGVILLVVEYFVLQPVRKANEHSISLLTGSASRDWSTAIKTAVKNFRGCQSNYLLSWISERFKVEKVHIEKGRATLTLAAISNLSLLCVIPWMSEVLDALNAFPYVLARYEVSIDRTGDILGFDPLQVEEGEKYRELFPTRSGPGRASRLNFPEQGITLGKIKPVKEKTSEGLKVKIRFMVKNWGPATKIYPYVEFKVAEFIDLRYKERVVRSEPGWEIELEAFRITPCVLEGTFDPTTLLLTKPPNKIKVRLHRQPFE